MPEIDSGPAERAAASLTRAGHVVHSCRRPRHRAMECVALETGSCPLEDEPIDVAVLARRWTRPEPLLNEQGALCAARRQIPLVVAGAVDVNPYRQWTSVVEAGDNVAEAVTRATRKPVAGLSEDATTVVRAALEGTSVAECRCEVRRRHGGLDVRVLIDPPLPRAARGAVAARIHQRLRVSDPWARSITLSFPEEETQ